MEGDFGAELDTALNANIAALRSEADEARARIAAGVSALSSQAGGLPSAPPAEPAVSVADDEAAVDAEGIPLPEEN
jgi:hypothetical protein